MPDEFFDYTGFLDWPSAIIGGNIIYIRLTRGLRFQLDRPRDVIGHGIRYMTLLWREIRTLGNPTLNGLTMQVAVIVDRTTELE